MTREEDDVRQARELVEAYNRHDLDTLVSCRHEDTTLVDHALGQTFRGRAEVGAYLQGNFEGIPDDRFEIHELFGAKGWTVARLSGSGTHRGEWGGIAPTNRVVRYELCTFGRWEDGLVVEEHVYYDLYGVLAQLGQVPPLTTAA